MKSQQTKSNKNSLAIYDTGSVNEKEVKQTELKSVINRFQTQNANLESLLNTILSQVYRLYPQYESDGCIINDNNNSKEPGSIVEQLNNLLVWQSGNVDKANEINDHLNRVI